MRLKKLLVMGLMLMSFVQLCEVSCYTPHENGGNRVTASGEYAAEGRTVAADHIPLGSKVIINGHEYTVCDRFGAGHTDKIDIFMEDYDRAVEFGRQSLVCEIIYAD